MKTTQYTATARGFQIFLAAIVGAVGLTFQAAAEEETIALHMVKATGPA